MSARPSADAAFEADARAHLAAARAPRAAGPADSVRAAYLDLLKLCLCDLAGALTVSVGAAPDGTVVSRELRGDERRLRAAGMDWPAQGLTMVGLRRLDDLQACVESIVADEVGGDLIEAGAWRGGASILMRAVLDTLADQRTVWVADSFDGFPAPPGTSELDLSAFDFLAVPLEEVRESFARFGLAEGVRFVEGFFEETLAGLAGRRWALARLDGDTYEATRHALRCLYPGLSAGGYLIVDDYGSFAGCRRAVDEFRAEHAITEPIERIDHTGARWRRETMAPLPAPPAVAAPRAVARRPAAPVPTARELALQARLDAAQAELERLRRRSPLERLRRRRRP